MDETRGPCGAATWTAVMCCSPWDGRIRAVWRWWGGGGELERSRRAAQGANLEAGTPAALDGCEWRTHRGGSGHAARLGISSLWVPLFVS
jgi:hypothetical protein